MKLTLRRALIAPVIAGALLVAGGMPALATSGECVPSAGWTETIPAVGEPTIWIDNPDYVPEQEEVVSWVEHPAETTTVCHAAVTHQEYRYEIQRPYWTVEHKQILIPSNPGDANRVTKWLQDIGGTPVGDGWWAIPDAVIAAVNFNPVTVADTGTVNISAYGGPSISVSYRKTHEVLGAPPASGFGITQASVRLYWNGTTWVTSQAAAVWLREAPPNGVQFDQRTVTDKDAWCETVVVKEAWTEKVVEQQFVPAQGSPTIEVPNPDYVPASTVEHPATVCTPPGGNETGDGSDDTAVDTGDPAGGTESQAVVDTGEQQVVTAVLAADDPAVVGPQAATGGQATGQHTGLLLAAAGLGGVGLAALGALGRSLVMARAGRAATGST